MNKDEQIATAMMKLNLEAAMRMRPKERYGTDWQLRRSAAEFAADDARHIAAGRPPIHRTYVNGYKPTECPTCHKCPTCGR